MPPKTERIELRLDEETVERIDQWREARGIATRSEAVRELIDQRLEEQTKDGFRLNKTDRLTMWMLAEILRNQINARPKRPSAIDLKDVDLVQEAIYGGHYWALNWEMSGIMHDHVDDPKRLRAVVDILDMWDFIESAYDKYPEASRNELAAAVGYRGENPRFLGFDGNNETEHLSIAQFLVENLGRFTRFKGRDFNSHMPTVARYMQMARVFQGVRPKLVGRTLSVAEMTELLKRE